MNKQVSFKLIISKCYFLLNVALSVFLFGNALETLILATLYILIYGIKQNCLQQS